MIERSRAMSALAAEEFDLVVIGGGITGAGVALDAASRGLAVALVERRDYAAGASGRSSKLLGADPRRRPGLDPDLVREAGRERDLIVRLAPRLVHPLPLVVPAFAGSGGEAQRAAGRGTGGAGPLSPRALSAAEIAELVPALARRGPRSGYLIDACQADDARLVLTLLSAAERRGAVLANRLEAIEVLERAGEVTGIEVRDAELDGRFVVAAGRVIDATGGWADRPPSARNGDATAPSRERGTHIVLGAEDLPLNGAGVVFPSRRAGRLVALPWLGRVLVGATDDEHGGEVDEARPRGDDVDHLLDSVNSFFGVALERADVAAAFAGFWPPVPPGGADRTAAPAPSAGLHVDDRGVISVAGGDLTAWRQIARLAVDRLLEQDGRTAPCRTDEIALAPRRNTTMPDRGSDHLRERYGAATAEVLALASEDAAGAQPILPSQPDLLAEATYAARDEQARSVGDVLLRRTRLGLVAAREVCDRAVAERVAAAMAPALGWGERRVADEASAWLREANAEGLVVAPDRGDRPDRPLD